MVSQCSSKILQFLTAVLKEMVLFSSFAHKGRGGRHRHRQLHQTVPGVREVHQDVRHALRQEDGHGRLAHLPEGLQGELGGERRVALINSFCLWTIMADRTSKWAAVLPKKFCPCFGRTKSILGPP